MRMIELSVIFDGQEYSVSKEIPEMFFKSSGLMSIWSALSPTATELLWKLAETIQKGKICVEIVGDARSAEIPLPLTPMETGVPTQTAGISRKEEFLNQMKRAELNPECLKTGETKYKE